MRKLIVAALLLSVSAPALADGRHRQPPPKHHNRNEAAAIGAVIGLGILSLGIVGAHYYNRPLPPECFKRIGGYDRYGREIWEVVCH